MWCRKGCHGDASSVHLSPRGVVFLVLWEKMRMSWANRGETMSVERINDLRLAASFVKSIETEDHNVNLEIQKVARRIERLASELNGY